jgi:7,8-dihydroneopterin aldolase/epimerase/oxygenase
MFIRLKDIPLYAHHGVHAFEKEHGARFEIDVEVKVADSSGVDDHLGSTLDYTALYKTVIDVSTHQKFNLLEAWASFLADQILQHYSHAEEVTLWIRKPGVPIGGPIGSVEVELKKHR